MLVLGVRTCPKRTTPLISFKKDTSSKLNFRAYYKIKVHHKKIVMRHRGKEFDSAFLKFIRLLVLSLGCHNMQPDDKHIFMSIQ